MPESVRERIMQHLVTTLQGVTTANGYANTLQSVQRYSITGQQLSQKPFVVVAEEDDVVQMDGERLAGDSSLLSRQLTVALLLCHDHDPTTDPRSSGQRMNSLIADIQTALQVDPRRGNIAIDTRELSIGGLVATEGQTDLTQSLHYQILYRHLRTNPTQEG